MLDALKSRFSGELYYNDSTRDQAMRHVYATDASVYQEKPLAVALPKTIADLQVLISFAYENNITLIPRAAGTSLAGQVVGNGIVTDISRYLTSILEVNQEEKWVRVQPGVIRDDLNAYLKPFGLMFGPETSTASRAMIGGMIGNNSSGLHSIIWGDTRRHLLEIKGFLADGTEAVFKDLTSDQLNQKMAQTNTEGQIYRALHTLLSDPENQEAIRTGFPKPSISRRNTGYALDALLPMVGPQPARPFNLCQLVAGSEGTLFFVTEAKLQLLDLPPAVAGLVAVHTTTVQEALLANLVALQHSCSSSELVDDFILEFTKTNIEQSKNRFFVEGEPKTILMVEFLAATPEIFLARTAALIADLKAAGIGYAYPVLSGDEAKQAWELRKAGLGLLRNLPGDTQAVNLIEDCAVDPQDLPAYIADVEALLQSHGVKYSMYAHAGAGQLHVEPMVNLKTTAGRERFRTILAQTTALVKKYKGSLSGEHGDGRLRGEFIPFMMGEHNYGLFREVKNIFDPRGVFNRGKIVDTPPMNQFLRYEANQQPSQQKTIFDFSAQESILHLAEKCSGSGDCRKTQVTGGTMCPSYMATRSERDTTRARANMLRHFYSNTLGGTQKVSMGEVKEVLDLCLSCKACKSECPSSVDVGKMKAEFTQQYYDRHGVPLRSRLVGGFTKNMELAGLAPWAYNAVFGTPALRRMVNKLVGFHPDRTMPLLHPTTLKKWWEKHSRQKTAARAARRKVLLFCDEFSNYNDVEVGQKLILLLERLGYEVLIPEHLESGRTYLSKGLVREAQKIATRNTELLADQVSEEMPLLGIEPSAILTLRDEYQELVPDQLKTAAVRLARHTFLFEEWFTREIQLGHIPASAFTSEARQIQIHGHCHQKALSSQSFIQTALSLPANYVVNLIPSGCCGMAGSFGYEAEHYDVSMQIGELVLFPAVRQQGPEVIIAAPGTSCRHQIKDGTGRGAQHPAEILYAALI